MGEQPETAQRALTFEARRKSIRKRDNFEGRTKHEFAGVKNERIVAAHFDEPRQFGLVESRIDHGVFVVVEEPKEAIEAHKQAITLKPDYAGAHFNLGVAYLVSGNKKGAVAEYQILQPLNVGMANQLYLMIYKKPPPGT